MTRRVAVSKGRKPRFGESEAIRILKKAHSAGARSLAEVDIGDDAAILRLKAGRLVVSADAAIEGTHFRDYLAPHEIASKSFGAAVSDLAAMGAEPLGAVCHLTLTSTVGPQFLREFSRAQAALAEAYACPVWGGNLARGSELSVVTTVFGRVGRASLKRSGARPGHSVWLVGELGLSRAGLELLERSPRRLRDSASKLAYEHFARPKAQIKRGIGLLGRAASAIDVSDGLAKDAAEVARQSGVHIELCEAELVEAAHPALALLAERLGASPLDLMLYGGEDYALLATGPERRRPPWAQKIGEVRAGTGLSLRGTREVRRLKVRGFTHHF